MLNISKSLHRKKVWRGDLKEARGSRQRMSINIKYIVQVMLIARCYIQNSLHTQTIGRDWQYYKLVLPVTELLKFNHIHFFWRILNPVCVEKPFVQWIIKSNQVRLMKSSSCTSRSVEAGLIVDFTDQEAVKPNPIPTCDWPVSALINKSVQYISILIYWTNPNGYCNSETWERTNHTVIVEFRSMRFLYTLCCQ